MCVLLFTSIWISHYSVLLCGFVILLLYSLLLGLVILLLHSTWICHSLPDYSSAGVDVLFDMDVLLNGLTVDKLAKNKHIRYIHTHTHTNLVIHNGLVVLNISMK